MKKTIIACWLIMSSAALIFADEVDLEMYSYLYNDAQTHVEQLDVLQSMVEARLSGAGDFYAGILRRLVAGYNSVKGSNEKNAVHEQTRMLASLVGAEKIASSAPDLWRIYIEFPDSAALTKAEALMSLGRIQATEYFRSVSRVLEMLNDRPPQDRLSGERIAYGAIIALEKYQDPAASIQVYSASISWYQDRIRSQAVKSLAILSESLTPYLIDIIKNPDSDYQLKLTALRTMDSSHATNDEKSSVALTALSVGWTLKPNVPAQQTMLAIIRQTAIDMIRRNGSNDEAVYPLLERSYTEVSQAIDERLATIATLASLGTEESVKLLSSFLRDLNHRQNAPTRIDEQMIRAIIPALGATKRSSARAALHSISGLDWTPAVKNLAQEALKQLPL